MGNETERSIQLDGVLTFFGLTTKEDDVRSMPTSTVDGSPRTTSADGDTAEVEVSGERAANHNEALDEIAPSEQAEPSVASTDRGPLSGEQVEILDEAIEDLAAQTQAEPNAVVTDGEGLADILGCFGLPMASFTSASVQESVEELDDWLNAASDGEDTGNGVEEEGREILEDKFQGDEPENAARRPEVAEMSSVNHVGCSQAFANSVTCESSCDAARTRPEAVRECKTPVTNEIVGEVSEVLRLFGLTPAS